jgi:hypothetical protein
MMQFEKIPAVTVQIEKDSHRAIGFLARGFGKRHPARAQFGIIFHQQGYITNMVHASENIPPQYPHIFRLSRRFPMSSLYYGFLRVWAIPQGRFQIVSMDIRSNGFGQRAG